MSTAQAPSALRWLPALREPERMAPWSLADWQFAIRQARRLRLLGRLAEGVHAAGLLDALPEQPRRLLLAEQRHSRWRIGVVMWAMQRVGAVLAEAPYPCLLLKGGAYLAQGLAIAPGRLPSDLDILVPHEHLADAQARLGHHGWVETELDAQDQHYYRAWGHELPPMTHPVHAVELDVHHNILPPVGHVRVPIDAMLAKAMPSGLTPWQVFQPIDQFLHSAAHLFFDSEPKDRVRDLVDMDGLGRHFGVEPAFWHALHARALELGLGEPLSLALHFLEHWFATPMPSELKPRIGELGLSPLRRAYLCALMAQVLTPCEPDALPSFTQNACANVVLARYHWRRLPLNLLLPHLWRKWRLRAQAVSPST